MRDMERTPISTPESLRVRCPHCRKLYLVQYADIQESKPRFECVECHDRFWISLPDMDFSIEVDGLPLSVKEAPQTARQQARATTQSESTEECPKCHKLTPKFAHECVHCGVVMSKSRRAMTFRENMPPHSPNLELLWHKVIAAYDDSHVHDDFIAAAEIEKSLPYAAALYAQMKKLMPVDETTLARLKQVEALGGVLVNPKLDEKNADRVSNEAGTIHPWRASRLWQFPLLAGVFLLVVGMSSPAMRNIAGLGAAFIFMAIVMRRR